jgi:predicted nucleotidyltransferase
MVIGGVAVFVYARSRLTQDVDVTIRVPLGSEAAIAQELASEFESRVTDPTDFLARTRVLPLRTRDGVPVDIVFGMLDLEVDMIGRARSVELGGRHVRVCAPEDLIAHKIISDRPRDMSDVEAIVESVGETLDRRYLRSVVDGLAEVLERPDVADRLRDLLS